MQTLIRAGKLITADDLNHVHHNRGVLIENGVIKAVDAWDHFASGDHPQFLDAQQYTVLPGLIDAHIHIATCDDDHQRSRMSFITEQPATTALRSVLHADRHLKKGVTTVRVVGTADWVDIAVRDAINAGSFPRPRMLVAGRGITSSLGHMDRHKQLRSDVQQGGSGNALIANSPNEARKAAWENLARGADLLKLNATMSTYISETDTIVNYPELPFASMKAICDVAHGAERMVAAHCNGGGIGIDMGRDAGVDTFEHCRFLTEPQMERMVELERFLIPTLSPEARMVDTGFKYPSAGEEGDTQRWMEIATEAMYDTVAKAHAKGVQIAAGTDVGMPNVPHGSVAYEMAHLAHAGLSTMDAIATGTRTAAAACGLADKIGQLRAGYLADLLVIDGDPLDDLGVLQKVEAIQFVIQRGNVVFDGNHRTREFAA